MEFPKYPKVYRLGHEETEGIFDEGTIVVQEKLDGANVRWMWDSEREELRFGSRRVEFTNQKKEYIPEQFHKFYDFIMNHITKRDFIADHVFYAEYMIPHTIEYDWKRTPLIIGFDVYDVTQKKFLPAGFARVLFEDLKIPFAPTIKEVDVDNIDEIVLKKLMPKKSHYGEICEGIVLKNYKLQKFAKIVNEDFQEVNAKRFGVPKKAITSSEQYLLERYVPPRRVQKAIEALVDMGHNLDMKLMEHLPSFVLKDVIEEEGVEIFRENIVVDLKKFRKLVSTRCAEILKQQISLYTRLKDDKFQQ